MRSNRPTGAPVDRLGKLCQEGTDIAAYLFQVPEDAAQRQRLGEILDEIIRCAARTNSRELPGIATDLKGVLAQAPSLAGVASFQEGFDRMTKLWAAARSGLF